MGAPTERYYFGDFRLWREGIHHWEIPTRGVTQEFEGVDQEHALVLPASSNTKLELAVRCLGAPNPADKTQKGWRALLRALRRGLVDRSLRSDPLVWIQDDGVSDVVGSYAAPQITANGHPFTNGDVVLVRRAGLGLWSLATVSSAAANTFDVAAVAGTSLHAIQAADELFLVEEYYLGMVGQLVEPAVPQTDQADVYAPELVYKFKGSGRYDYARTSASVGS